MKMLFHLPVLAAVILFAGCATRLDFSETDSHKTRINDSLGADSAVLLLIAPYKTALEAEMNEVIGSCETELQKAQPNSTLGNFVADALLFQLEEATGIKVDFSVVNYGGIRLPSLPQGPVTVGKIFELLPFDNSVVITEMTGEDLLAFSSAFVRKGGWPVSGLRITVHDDSVTEILVRGAEISPSEIYHGALPDYVANGGDQMEMLRPLARKDTNLLLRDLVINHIRKLTADEQNIISVTEERIDVE